jgi:hypothetical protein
MVVVKTTYVNPQFQKPPSTTCFRVEKGWCYKLIRLNLGHYWRRGFNLWVLGRSMHLRGVV